MTSGSRRQFLKAGLATAAAMAMPASIRQAMAIPAHNATGTLRDVEHIVVLMRENRSFDHYFGTLNGVRGFGDPRPAPLPSGRPVWYQSVGRNGAGRTGYDDVGWDHWHERERWYEADPKAQARLDYEYTVGAGDALSDSWTPDHGRSYDLSVYGPNGMLNRFKGRLTPILSGQARPEMRLMQDGVTGDVSLLLSNTGFRPCYLTVANGYSAEPPRHLYLRPGALVRDRWSLRGSSGWFDLSVTAGTGDGFLRRFAGHVETGRPSLTDPKLGGLAVEMV